MAKTMPIKSKDAAKLRQKARIEAFYQKAYETLRHVVEFKDYKTFETLPRKGKIIRDVVNTGTRKKPRYETFTESGYKFTAAQKALLVKLGTYKPTPEALQRDPALKRVNRRIKSALFNSGDAVANKAYTVIKLSKAQRRFFQSNPANQVTSKGLILKSATVKPKIKKLGTGYAISFSAPKKDGSASNRKEVYVSIPEEIKGHFAAIQAFMTRVNTISRASNFTLAIRTFHGKTTIHPKLFLRYTQELNDSSPEAFSGDNPFISGFYIITFKDITPEVLIQQINDDKVIQDIIGDPFAYTEDDF